VTRKQDDGNPDRRGPGFRHSRISLARVKLFDTDLSLVDEWEGFLVPEYLDGLPNVNARYTYKLEVEGITTPDDTALMLWQIPPGNLKDEVWQQLIWLDNQEMP